MADGIVVRKGEGKNVKLGPDDWLFRLTGDETGGRFDYMEATVTYLQGAPLHLHHEMDDTIIVVEGTLKVLMDDKMTDLHAGDLMCAPKGVPHAFANVEKEPCRIINIMTPGNFHPALEDFATLPRGEYDPKIRQDMDKKHRSEFVGPGIPERLGLV